MLKGDTQGQPLGPTHHTHKHMQIHTDSHTHTHEHVHMYKHMLSPSTLQTTKAHVIPGSKRCQALLWKTHLGSLRPIKALKSIFVKN